MRYGKVYFYDRMGNREQRDSDRVRDALNAFDAPRFAPPPSHDIAKRYVSKFSPLSSPPPLELRSSDLLMEPVLSNPLVQRELIMDDSERELPLMRPSLPYSVPQPPPADPFPSMAPEPRSLDPLVGYRGGLDMEGDVERGLPFLRHSDSDEPALLAGDLARFRMDNGVDEGMRMLRGLREEEEGEWRGGGGTGLGGGEGGRLQLGRYDGRLEESTHETSHGWSGGVEDSEICAQCRAEDLYMATMKAQNEKELARRQAASERAAAYEADLARKEAEVMREESQRRAALQAHVDGINRDMVEERRRRVPSPPMDYAIFRHEDGATEEARKAAEQSAYGKALEGQIDGKRRDRIRARDHDDDLDVASNERAARELADGAAAARRQRAHDSEALQKSLQFQMEMKARRPLSGTEPLWWSQRPDEHGWRAARLARRHAERQLNKNGQLQTNVARLEDFISRQHADDAVAREGERARHARLREKMHQQNALMTQDEELLGKRRFTTNGGIDPRVEAAWREAHERNDKRYRVLQEAKGGGGVIGVKEGCRRCIRCARPLHGAKGGRTTMVEWHPL